MLCSQEWVASHGLSGCLLGPGVEEEGHMLTHTDLSVMEPTAAADRIAPTREIAPLSPTVSDAHTPQWR